MLEFPGAGEQVGLGPLDPCGQRESAARRRPGVVPVVDLVGDVLGPVEEQDDLPPAPEHGHGAMAPELFRSAGTGRGGEDTGLEQERVGTSRVASAFQGLPQPAPAVGPGGAGLGPEDLEQGPAGAADEQRPAGLGHRPVGVDDGERRRHEQQGRRGDVEHPRVVRSRRPTTIHAASSAGRTATDIGRVSVSRAPLGGGTVMPSMAEAVGVSRRRLEGRRCLTRVIAPTSRRGAHGSTTAPAVPPVPPARPSQTGAGSGGRMRRRRDPLSYDEWGAMVVHGVASVVRTVEAGRRGRPRDRMDEAVVRQGTLPRHLPPRPDPPAARARRGHGGEGRGLPPAPPRLPHRACRPAADRARGEDPRRASSRASRSWVPSA